MNDERLRILKLLEEGKITAEEAYKLLRAYEEDTGEVKNFVLKVKDGDETVNIKIPIPVVKASMKLAGGIMKIVPNQVKEELEEQNVDIQSILDGFANSIPDKPITIMEIEDEDGTHIYMGFE